MVFLPFGADGLTTRDRKAGSEKDYNLAASTALPKRAVLVTWCLFGAGPCDFCLRRSCVPRSHFRRQCLLGTRLKFTSILFLLLAFALTLDLISSSSWAKETSSFTGTVIGITDGDTIKALQGKTTEKIRLIGIDCPEKKQPFGQKAKRFASDLAFKKTVTVFHQGRDRYGRILGDVHLPDGRILNQELVKAGLAWWYRRYSKDQELERLETEAREAKRGLWADPNPIPPWQWRRSKRSR